MDNCYRFTGQERDPESGLDHFLYRKYASNLGRWTTPDPVMATRYEPQSLNRYGYVMNNPSNLTDCKGLSFLPRPHCMRVPLTVFIPGEFGLGGFDRAEGYYRYICPLDPFEGDSPFADSLFSRTGLLFGVICECEITILSPCWMGCIYACICSGGYGRPFMLLLE